MRPRLAVATSIVVALLAAACGVTMQPELPELASGTFNGWEWILAGETVEVRNEACIELLTSPGSSVHGGGADCRAVPPNDGLENVGRGASRSGDQEIANVHAILGSDVAEVRLLPDRNSNGEAVFVKESPTDLAWFLFLYDPQEVTAPTGLILVDKAGNELGEYELPPMQ